MADVLVLDMNYRPSGFTSVRRAMKNIYEKRADVIAVDHDSTKVVRAGRVSADPDAARSFEMGMPRVIRVHNAWVRRKKQSVPMTRRNIYTRDEGECQYCGKELALNNYTLDHVKPRVQGGLSSWTNLVTACQRCNKRKAGQTPEQAGMRLLSKPLEPKVDDPKYNFKLHIKHLRPEWKEWADWLYWNIELEP